MRALAAVLVVVSALPAAAASAPRAPARCPRGLQPLGRNAIAPATQAALRAVPKQEDPQIISASLAPADVTRGRQARFECGVTVWRRTVVVYFTRRAYLPAQSASQGVAFVGRFRSGYRIWELAH